MSRQKLWAWQIAIVNGKIANVDAKPVDYYTGGSDDAYITAMYRRRDDFTVEIGTLAETRTEAERLARAVFDRDVPADMRGDGEGSA